MKSKRFLGSALLVALNSRGAEPSKKLSCWQQLGEAVGVFVDQASEAHSALFDRKKPAPSKVADPWPFEDNMAAMRQDVRASSPQQFQRIQSSFQSNASTHVPIVTWEQTQRENHERARMHLLASHGKPYFQNEFQKACRDWISSGVLTPLSCWQGLPLLKETVKSKEDFFLFTGILGGTSLIIWSSFKWAHSNVHHSESPQ